MCAPPPRYHLIDPCGEFVLDNFFWGTSFMGIPNSAFKCLCAFFFFFLLQLASFSSSSPALLNGRLQQVWVKPPGKVILASEHLISVVA